MIDDKMQGYMAMNGYGTVPSIFSSFHGDIAYSDKMPKKSDVMKVKSPHQTIHMLP